MTALKVQTGPATEPVSLTEAKNHLRVSGSTDDTMITSMTIAAREQAEQRTGRALITQTWDYWIDKFGSYYDMVMPLPKPPLQSVSYVKYLDTNGDLQTHDSSLYRVDANSEPGRLYPIYGEVWPDVYFEPHAVNIRFIAGYANAGAVPQDIKNWMLLFIGDLYEMRENFVTGTIVEHTGSKFSDRLLDPYYVARAGM